MRISHALFLTDIEKITKLDPIIPLQYLPSLPGIFMQK